jgi:hypothetical protein
MGSYRGADTRSRAELNLRLDVYKINRVLRWYEKNGNALIGETLLRGCSFAELQHILNEPIDSPMFFSYQLTVDIHPALK